VAEADRNRLSLASWPARDGRAFGIFSMPWSADRPGHGNGPGRNERKWMRDFVLGPGEGVSRKE